MQSHASRDLLESRWGRLVRRCAFNGSQGDVKDDNIEFDDNPVTQYIGKPDITEAWAEDLSKGEHSHNEN